MTEGETKKGGQHHHVPVQSKHEMTSQIVERRKESGRRKTDPNTEKLVELVTQVLGALEGLSLSVGEVRKAIEEQNRHQTNGGH